MHLEAFNKDILMKKGQKLIRDMNAFKDGKAYKLTQNRQNQNKGNYYQGHQSTSSRQTSNLPQIPPQIPHKSKIAQSTKRLYQGDSTEGQQAKKLTLDIPKKSSHSTPTHQTIETSNSCVNTHTSTNENLHAQQNKTRESSSQSNTSTIESIHTISNDPSFLEKILMDAQPTQSNLNTYTQIAL